MCVYIWRFYCFFPTRVRYMEHICVKLFPCIYIQGVKNVDPFKNFQSSTQWSRRGKIQYLLTYQYGTMGRWSRTEHINRSIQCDHVSKTSPSRHAHLKHLKTEQLTINTAITSWWHLPWRNQMYPLVISHSKLEHHHF